MTTAELIAACRTRLAQMREREQKATPGPWMGTTRPPLDVQTKYKRGKIGHLSICSVYTQGPETEANASFIDSSRTDLPALLTFAEQELEAEEDSWNTLDPIVRDELSRTVRPRLDRLARALGVL